MVISSVRWRQPLVALIAVVIGSGAAMANETNPPPADSSSDNTPAVRVASLIYFKGSGGKSNHCFSSGFLDDVARQTRIKVERELQVVNVASTNLFQYPFVVFTGEGAFTLNDAETKNLRAYLRHGGFVLASAGCASPEWAKSFRDTIARVLPDNQAKKIPLDHPVFHTLYNIEAIQPAHADGGADLAIYGYEIGDRLAVVFSPTGLNDTGNAGGNCCCCGGNEIRNARLINADILAYALTH